MKKSKRDNKPLIIACVFALLILFLFLFRAFSHTELDDVTPGIQCDKELIEKSDILWVIPDFNNESIAENREWCDEILSYHKQLGLHGVYHTFNEFGYKRDSDYLQLGINDFEKCFGEKPRIFKAPQLKLSRENRKMIEDNGLEVKRKINQLFHKVYHCSDTGLYSNKFIDVF